MATNYISKRLDIKSSIKLDFMKKKLLIFIGK